MRSIHHASECQRKCLDEDIVVIEQSEDKTILNRNASTLIEKWEKEYANLTTFNSKKYQLNIKEKSLNDEFEVIRNYVARDQMAQEEEFHKTQKEADYYSVESAIDHAFEGNIFSFFTNQDCRDDFKKSQFVEIPNAQDKILGIVSDVENNRLKIRFKDSVEIPVKGIIRQIFNKRTFETQKKCLTSLMNKNAEEIAIKNVMCNMDTFLTTPDVKEEFYFNPNVATISRQKKAVDLASAELPMLLIQGPPGTGKTTVIYEMIRQCLKNPKNRVLMASQSNAAVDNVLHKLHGDKTRGDDIIGVRVGREESCTIPEAKEYLFPLMFRDFQKEVREKTDEAYEKLHKNVSVLKNTVFELAHLADLESKQKNKNKELGSAEKKLSEHIKMETVLTHSLSETKQQLRELETKIEASKNSSFKKAFNGFLSLINEDPKSKLEKAEVKLSGLFKKKNSLETHIENTKSKIKRFQNQLSKLSGDKKKFSKPILKIAEKGLEALEKNKNNQNRILKKRECVFSLIQEWKTFVEEGQEALAEYLKKRANLVFATCIGISNAKYFNSLDFDLVVVDECSRATMMEIMVPLIRGGRFILVGDHLQLPPTISRSTMESCRKSKAIGNIDNNSSLDYLQCLKGTYCGQMCYYNISFFEHLFQNDNYPDSIKLTLNTQFRMHPDIADFISDTFYDNNNPLKHGDQTVNHKLSLITFPKQIHIISTLPHGVGLEKLKGFSKINPIESDIICNIIKKIAFESSEPTTIGALSFYKSQVERIQSDLNKIQIDMTYIRELEIATLDSFQGKEKDIIIISFVRSVKHSQKARLDFVLDLQRLNVAMSRASKKLLIVGDIKTLKKYSKVLDTDLDVISCLINHVEKKGSIIDFWHDRRKMVGRQK